ncbi:unnamed protein product [Lupinus luteus]|uniref:RRM domain-containing protein n=1 Tax=Lupinus luteus TaxID=3873 RepID=A0AAV1WKN6_LUPLU
MTQAQDCMGQEQSLSHLECCGYVLELIPNLILLQKRERDREREGVSEQGVLRPHVYQSTHAPRREFGRLTQAGPVKGRKEGGGVLGSGLEVFSSFYVTNFPGNYGVKELWNLFQKKGRVRDVFIPTKRNRNNQHFAFIRFDKVMDERKFAAELDKVWIGSSKILANILKFSRNQHARTTAPKLFPSRVGAFKLRDDRSYSVVTRGGEFDKKVQPVVAEGDSLVEYVSDPKDLEWLRACMIGKTVESVDPYMVVGLLKAEGLFTVVAQPLGNDLVLISPVEGEDIHDFISDAKDWISAIFSSFSPRSEDLVIGDREVWLCCYGIPIHAWNLEFFRLLVKGCFMCMVFDNFVSFFEFYEFYQNYLLIFVLYFYFV